MKTIILFRHGKSDWDADYNRDHERPLAPRGIKAAKKMGKWLRETDQVPEHLFSSSAVRARTTLELAKEAGEWPAEIIIKGELYDSSVHDYVSVARQTPEHASSVLIAGHEPTCSMTTQFLAGGGDVRFPTAAMARLDFYGDSWEDLRQGACQLIWFMPPKFF